MPAARYNPSTAPRMISRSSSFIGSQFSAIFSQRSCQGPSCARASSVSSYGGSAAFLRATELVRDPQRFFGVRPFALLANLVNAGREVNRAVFFVRHVDPRSGHNAQKPHVEHLILFAAFRCDEQLGFSIKDGVRVPGYLAVREHDASAVARNRLKGLRQ